MPEKEKLKILADNAAERTKAFGEKEHKVSGWVLIAGAVLALIGLWAFLGWVF
jgi:hypothetical protein